MNHVKSTPCITPGCKFLAADDIRCSGLCGECFRKDCEAGIEDALAIRENMRKYGCIDVPVLIKDAKLYVDMIRDGKTLNTREETAAISLARVTVMLALYGSKPESILDVIHQRGWTDVTIDDVYEVRNYVLESPNG